MADVYYKQVLRYLLDSLSLRRHAHGRQSEGLATRDYLLDKGV